ncbi:MAG TPA: pseudouridine synthase [Pseudogracilibacillus sp.]|nr:pseudouridine synthase [Pseudogracilibacillus sp.]
MRIDKMLAHMGYGTRKEVRQLIKGKQVKVNGKITTKQGSHVDPETDEVTVSGELVEYVEFVYLLLNKPANYITATYDHHDLTVIDLVPFEYSHYDLAPVGRLDKDTEGLILLTNDGQVNHLLTSPKNDIWKTYEAEVSGEVTAAHIEEFSQGITLDDGYKTKAAQLEIITSSATVSTIRLSITEGKFHQVKRMFRAIGMEVVYLKRTHIGELQLDSSLDIGEIRQVNENEMQWIDNIKEGE